MSQKKLTPTIAKALAEKVKQELQKRNKNLSETIKQKAEASKEFKSYVKLCKEIEELEVKKETLRETIVQKFSSQLCDVNIPSYSKQPHIYVRETSFLSLDSIKDLILIEDFMSDSNVTSDEFINLIIEKLTK